MPEGFSYLVELFWQIFDSGTPITYQELKAFSDINGTSISAFEADAIRQMSDAARKKIQEVQGE